MSAGDVVTVTLNAAVDQTLDCPGFAAGTVNRVASQVVHPGGKGINVAAFLAGRATSVTASGFLGVDNAAVFEALFAARGIRDACLRVAGASRVNVKVVDWTSGQVTDINLPGLAVDADALVLLTAHLDALAAARTWFVLAGSVPGGVPDDVYASLVARLRAREVLVAVDASGEALRHAVAASPDLIKPNVHELAELVGRTLAGPGDVLQAARALQQGGVGMVVVSMGADGAILVDDRAALRAMPPSVEVASTVGAGDALVAGVIAARLGGGDLEACARSGTAFAAGTLSQIGPVLPSPERLAALAEAVRIEHLGGV